MAGFIKKLFNGITEKTMENLQLDAGVVFKNFDVNKDTYESAKTAGKCLGATQGGGTFTAKAAFRQISIDGTIGRVKGATDVTSWDVSFSTTVLETTPETLRLALGAAEIVTASDDKTTIPSGYKLVRGKNHVSDEDYIENITWIGNLTGSDKPIIIQVFNAFNEDGLAYAVADQSEGKVGMTLWGYNSIEEFMEGDIQPPFAIYYPDTSAAAATTSETGDDAASSEEGTA